MLMTLEFSDLLSEKKKKMESLLDMMFARTDAASRFFLHICPPSNI